jgi:outer membrane protein assembly factor BamB
MEADGKVRGSAAVKDGVVYIGSSDGTMHALDADTGTVRWQKKIGDGKLCGSPGVAYGVVFIPTGNSGGLQEVRMVAGPTVGLDVETGQEVWRKFSQRGSQGFASPLIAGDTLYGDNCTSFEAIDLRTGKVRWSVVAVGQSKQFNPMALSGGLIYNTGPLAGVVMAVDAGTGRVAWSQYAYEKQKHLRYGGGPGHEVLTGPALAHGRVYVGCNDGHLYTFDAETGERGWKWRAPDTIRSSAAVAGDVLYFGCDDGNLYALDATSGEKLWEFATGGAVVSSPWPADGTVYVGSDDGRLYALH